MGYGVRDVIVVIIWVVCAVEIVREAVHQKHQSTCAAAYKTQSYDVKNGVLYCEKTPGKWNKP